MLFEVKAAYKEWLKGSSLRAIGAKYGIPHGSIHSIFRKTYGVNACSLKAKSLVRSVIEDYEKDEQVIEWAVKQHMNTDENYYKSNHSLQQLSSFQTLREPYLLETVEALPWVDPDDTTLDFLRLPLYLLNLDVMMDVLANYTLAYHLEETEDVT